MKVFGNIAHIAGRDYAHEWRLSLCAVLALAAVLAPLLVLLGLKHGVMSTLIERLAREPRNRELLPVGGHRFAPAWFTTLATRPEVAFVIPRTRQIAGTLDLRRPDLGRSLTVELLPTASGDPLLPVGVAPPSEPLQLLISQSAAEKLQLRVGDQLPAAVSRSHGSRLEYASLTVTVGTVLPLTAFGRDAAFVQLDLLEAVEDYRDGFAVERFGWPGQPAATDPPERRYPAFRLYARSLEEVAPLRDHLLSQGIEVETQAAAIAQVQALNRNLTAIFALIATLSAAGYACALGINVLAAIERKRRELSILRLLGLPGRGLVWFPLLQALLTAGFGLILAGLAYTLAGATINHWFADQVEPGEMVCRLRIEHGLYAAAATVLIMLLAASVGGWRAARIEPAEGLRDG
ncbi:MAG: ABC transporter permease [Candidatus Competibacter sp.]|nr:ABC transporter permease [Candidatus Competibacter sp.]MDG4605386.1 ABC transporter permease [Candidatus Contendobacter sp.]HRD48479.1 ABC transporter permease [Candidatus Contendobacter sp.]